MSNLLTLPVAAQYESITNALNEDELFALVEALSMVPTASAENDRLRTAIVRELSIREAYIRGAKRRHPSGGSD
jgi:hypothetical protein